jgi:hypothetical protein
MKRNNKKNMLSYIKTWDFLGPGIKIMIKNKESYTTATGGFMSIILIFIAVLAIFGFGRDIYQRQHPEIVFNKVINESPAFNFTGDTLFMFSLFDLYNNLIIDSEKKFYIYVVLQDNDPQRSTGAATLIQTYYNLQRCDESRNSLELKPFLLQKITDYWCFPRNLTLPLKGTFLNGASVHLKLNVDICKNSTSNANSCLPAEQIRNSLGIFNFQYIIFDNYMDGKQSRPGKPIIQSGASKTSSNSFQRLTFWLKLTEYFSDDGWILESTRTNLYTGVDRIASEIFIQENTSTFFSHIISISGLKDQYFRKYIKIQAIISFVGGFLTFFKFILISFNTYLAAPYLINTFQKSFFHKTPKLNLYGGNDNHSFNNIPIKKIQTSNTNIGFLNFKNKYATEKELLTLNQSEKASQLGIQTYSNLFLKISPSAMLEKKQNIANLQKTKSIKDKDLHKAIKMKEKELYIESNINKKNTFYNNNFQKLSILEKLFRICCIKTKSLRVKVLHLKYLEEKLKGQISLETIIKNFRKVNLIENLVFEEYQIHLLKYIPTKEKLKKSSSKLEECINELKKNLYSDKVKINDKLFGMLEFR